MEHSNWNALQTSPLLSTNGFSQRPQHHLSIGVASYAALDGAPSSVLLCGITERIISEAEGLFPSQAIAQQYLTVVEYANLFQPSQRQLLVKDCNTSQKGMNI